MTLEPDDIVLAYWSGALNPDVAGRNGDILLTAWRTKAGVNNAELRFKYYESMAFDGRDEVSRYKLAPDDSGLAGPDFVAWVQRAVDGMALTGGFFDLHRVDVNGDHRALRDAMLNDPHLAVNVTVLKNEARR